MIIRIEKVVNEGNNFVQFGIHGINIDVGSWFLCFGSANTFFKIYKVKKEEEFLIYESEVKEGKNPTFNQVKLKVKKLCNNNPLQPIIVRFY